MQLGAFLNNPRRVAGVCGLTFLVLFIVGGPVLQGTTPTMNDSVADIRSYWVDNGDQYLTGDFLFSIGVMVLFIPFIFALHGVLEPQDKSGGMWARTMIGGALVAVALGGAGAAAYGAIALSGADTLDDGTLRLATGLQAYSLAGLGYGFAVTLSAASVVIAQSRSLWRWLAVLGALAALANILGGLWVPDRDQEGAFAIVGFIGLNLTLVWVLLVSVQLLLPRTGAVEAAQPLASPSIR